MLVNRIANEPIKAIKKIVKIKQDKEAKKIIDSISIDKLILKK